MVIRNLAGGAHQVGPVIFLLRVAATVGFVSTYTSFSEDRQHWVGLYIHLC